MRILFMGTPEFSVPTLQCLYDAGHEIVGVVTQPDKPKGRGGAVSFPPVKERALALSLPVYQPRRVREKEFIQTVEQLAPDVAVVVAFGQILPQAFLDIPRYGCINVHASLLPRYRGAAPIQRVVIDGEKETGITIMQMDAGLDTGDMLARERIAIAADETGGSLHDKLMVMGGPLLLTVLKEIEEGRAVRTPQTGETCYASMLDKALGNVDWNDGADRIERLVRGLNPWPSAYTRWNGKTIKLWKAFVRQPQEAEAAAEPGTVVRLGETIDVRTGEGVLQISELQLEGKKRMDAAAFLRGAHMQAGDKFARE